MCRISAKIKIFCIAEWIFSPRGMVLVIRLRDRIAHSNILFITYSRIFVHMLQVTLKMNVWAVHSLLAPVHRHDPFFCGFEVTSFAKWTLTSYMACARV